MSVLSSKVTLAVLFACSLVTANITAAKVTSLELPIFGAVAVPAGFVAMGVAFLMTDLIGEFYGRQYAREVVNASVIGLVLTWMLIYVAVTMPAAPFYPHGDEFATVLGESSIVITAGIISILVAQNLDVTIFHEIRDRTGGGRKWARNLLSTSASQLIDTAMFITLAFAALPIVFGGEVTPLAAIPGMIIAQYIAKMVVAVGETPLFYAATALR